MRDKTEVNQLLTEVIKPSEIELKDRKIAELERNLRAARKEAADNRTTSEFLDELGRPVITKIEAPAKSSKDNSGFATALLVASDWHVEEMVEPTTVSGLNKYNPDIAKKRSEAFFKTGLRLTDIVARDIAIPSMTLAFLGDFLTNELHEDSAENNAMTPMEATLFAQDLLSSGIKYLLENSERHLDIVCHSGNHGRVTKRVHHAKEKGHSLEYMMYRNLAKFYEKEDRVRWSIPDGYHSYVDIFGVKVRFHHGHKVQYNGGVGGITIPVNKSINEWNKGIRADLDVFGHFHQYFDGGNFLANGSLIGYNAYALSIKASPEAPRQSFSIIDSKRGRTWTNSIYVER
jgi:hypothetical protein